MTLNTAALLAWLRDHAHHRNPLIASIYTGLAARIERGDFNTPPPRKEE